MLDVRWALTTANTPAGREDYDAGHVPGAFFVDLDTELAAPPGDGGRHPLPDPAVVEALLRRAGITEHSRVVAYDGKESYAAARAWWVLRWVGVADVRVLDGGYAAWLAAGLPVSTEEPADRHGDVEVRPGQLPTLDAGRCGGAGPRRAAPRRPGARALRRRDRADRPGGRTRPGRGQQPDVRLDHGRRHLPPRPRRALGARCAAGHDVGGGAVGVYCGSGVTAAHQCSRWPSSASTRCSTPARGASGSATRPARSPPAASPADPTLIERAIRRTRADETR